MEAATAPARSAATEYTGQSPFPPIADYAFLSDCETVALVAPSGNVEWLCLPRPDSPSVFGAILDRDAGGSRLAPADGTVPAGRRYLPGTNVLETTWMSRMGWLIVRDALLVGPWHDEEERSNTHRRAPTDDDAEHVLLRFVHCVQGVVEVHLDCEPNFDYARKGAEWKYTGEGYNEAVATAEGCDVELKLRTDLRVGFEGRRARARHTLREGESAYAALAWSEHAPPQDVVEAAQRMLRTEKFWAEWLNHGVFPDHPWRVYLQRSALTLKGLTYAPTGAMLAAATTSLPETPHGERHWDYRYSWIRDSTFMLWGLYTLGLDWEANDFFYFVADVAGRPDEDLQGMYGIGGEKAEAWQAAAHEIRDDICTNGLNKDGVFCQHYETDALDASVLLMPLVRFLPPTDERIRKTVLAIADGLTENGLVLRYRVDETDDGMSGKEGTFAICSFWLVSALAEIDEPQRARQLCERMLSYASPLYLYAEEIDAMTGRHLGNFPQAFTHLALINAVMHVVRADREESTRRFSRARRGSARAA